MHTTSNQAPGVEVVIRLIGSLQPLALVHRRRNIRKRDHRRYLLRMAHRGYPDAEAWGLHEIFAFRSDRHFQLGPPSSHYHARIRQASPPQRVQPRMLTGRRRLLPQHLFGGQRRLHWVLNASRAYWVHRAGEGCECDRTALFQSL